MMAMENQRILDVETLRLQKGAQELTARTEKLLQLCNSLDNAVRVRLISFSRSIDLLTTKEMGDFENQINIIQNDINLIRFLQSQ